MKDNKIWLMDTASYADDMDGDLFFNDELENVTETIGSMIEYYEKRYRTEIGALVWKSERSSHYGAIGSNGATGFFVDIRKQGDLDIKLPQGADDIEIYIDTNDRNIHLNKYDHDGTDYAVLYFITTAELESPMYDNYTREDACIQIAQKKNPVKVAKSLINIEKNQ